MMSRLTVPISLFSLHQKKIRTLGENTNTATLIQTLKHRTIRLILVDIWQDLVLPPTLGPFIRPHPLRSLDVAITVFTGDGKVRLEPQFRITNDLFDRGRGVRDALGEHDLAARFDFRGEFGALTSDEQGVSGGEGDSARACFGVVCCSGNGDCIRQLDRSSQGINHQLRRDSLLSMMPATKPTNFLFMLYLISYTLLATGRNHSSDVPWQPSTPTPSSSPPSVPH